MIPSAVQPCVLIVAGEASGDAHGAAVVRALRRQRPDLFAFGIGGPAMARAGVRLVADVSSLSVVGITEVAAKLPALVGSLRAVRQLIRRLRPDLVLLIDFPDFNLRVAPAARRAGVPVLYYVSPQIWAWRSGRVKRIASLVDHMAVILPFEAEFYQRHGIPVTFVGHPLLEHASPPPGALPPAAGPPCIGLLPGSRDREIARLLPNMLAAAGLVGRDHPRARFLVSLAPTADRQQVTGLLAAHRGPAAVELVDEPVRHLLRRCRLVVAASGTVTLEAAIEGVPMVVVYRVSPLSYWVGRRLIRVSHIGLANLIAGRTIVPELIQQETRPERLAAEVNALLADPAALTEQRRALLDLRSRLGSRQASRRVARLALDLMAGGGHGS